MSAVPSSRPPQLARCDTVLVQLYLWRHVTLMFGSSAEKNFFASLAVLAVHVRRVVLSYMFWKRPRVEVGPSLADVSLPMKTLLTTSAALDLDRDSIPCCTEATATVTP